MKSKFEDSVLGELVWEKNYDWWGGKVGFKSDLKFQIRLSGDQKNIFDNINEYQEFYKNFRQNESNARLYASEKLLDLHNESWLDEDEEEITQEEFCRRIRLESLIIYEDKSAEIYYADDDLFWGHVIIVSLNENGEFTDATIAG